MLNGKRHRYVLMMGTLVLLAASFDEARAMTCRDLFVSKPVRAKARPLQQHNSGLVVVGAAHIDSNKSTNMVEAEQISMRLRENVEIQDRFSQSPNLTLIGPHYIQSHFYLNNEGGDFVSVRFYLKGDPMMKSQQAQLPSPAANPQLGYRPGGLSLVPSGQALVTQSRGVVTQTTPLVLRQHEIPGALHKYFTDVVSTPSNPLDARSIQYLVEQMKNSPEIIEEARVYLERVRNEGEFVKNAPLAKISNFGEDRYIRFTPSRTGVEVEARVLDLHRQQQPYGFYMLVEWLVPSRDGNFRYIQLISEAELRTIKILTTAEKSQVAQSFNESLSPNELNARKLAKILNLETFGYTDFRRVPGEGLRNGTDPLTQMSNISHLAIRRYIEDKFGRIDDLMTKEELSQPLGNILDVMARLNPRYVLKRFASKGDGFRYGFVITEDGQLKVNPHGEKDVNLKRQSIRLAAGRRVFAAGSFEMDVYGDLRVTLESNYYQDHAASWGTQSSFRTETNGNLDAFVTAIFELQAGVKVHTISGKTVESYGETGWDGRPSGGATFGGRFGGFESEEAARFVRQAKNSTTNHSAEKTLDWDASQPAGRPLNYVDWIKQTNRSVQDESMTSTKIVWAHYVLRTNQDMPLEKIRKSYRRLMMRFHSDRSPEFAKTDVERVVNGAFQVIENQAK